MVWLWLLSLLVCVVIWVSWLVCFGFSGCLIACWLPYGLLLSVCSLFVDFVVDRALLGWFGYVPALCVGLLYLLVFGFSLNDC